MFDYVQNRVNTIINRHINKLSLSEIITFVSRKILKIVSKDHCNQASQLSKMRRPSSPSIAHSILPSPTRLALPRCLPGDCHTRTRIKPSKLPAYYQQQQQRRRGLRLHAGCSLLFGAIHAAAEPQLRQQWSQQPESQSVYVIDLAHRFHRTSCFCLACTCIYCQDSFSLLFKDVAVKVICLKSQKI